MRYRLGVMAAVALLGGAAPGAVAAPLLSDSDLAVVRMDPAPVRPGGTVTVHAFVANLGPDPTASPFSVTITLPPGVTAQGPYFPAGCQADALGTSVSCTFPAGLAAGRSATALVPVVIAPSVRAPQQLSGGMVVLTSPDDQNPANDAAPFTVSVVS